MSENLQVLEPQHSHGHVLARLCENAGHTHLLCNHSGTHLHSFLSIVGAIRVTARGPVSFGSEFDFDVDTGGEIELH